LEKGEETSIWERVKEAFEDTLVRILLVAAFISLIIALTGKYLIYVDFSPNYFYR
jgi:magnesium-transporting ATPase (P-type)